MGDWISTDQKSLGGGSFEYEPVVIRASRTTSSDETLLASDSTVLVNASGDNRIITLPPAGTNLNRVYKIKKIDSSLNLVTIDADGSETIDGALTKILVAQYQSITIQSDGTEWWVI